MSDESREMMVGNMKSISLEEIYPGVDREEFVNAARSIAGLEFDPNDVFNTLRGDGYIKDLRRLEGLSHEEREMYRRIIDLYLYERLQRYRDVYREMVLGAREVIQNLMEEERITDSVENKLQTSLKPLLSKSASLRLIRHDPNILPYKSQRSDFWGVDMATMATVLGEDYVRKINVFASNFYHDLLNIFELYKIDMLTYRILNGDEKALDKIKKWWFVGVEGNTALMITDLFFSSYMEELFPGVLAQRSQARPVLEAIGSILSSRFNLSLISEEVEIRDGKEGSIIIQIDPGTEVLPISDAGLFRIFYNLVKNTIKAWEEERERAGEKSQKNIKIEISVKQLLGGKAVAVVQKDNGPGFDLRVPFTSLRRLIQEHPEIIDEIKEEISPELAGILKTYYREGKDFIIYKMNLEEVFRLFLIRRITGKGIEQSETSGVGLSSVRAMITSAVPNGEIFVTNSHDGGALVAAIFPLEEGVSPRDAIFEIST